MTDRREESAADWCDHGMSAHGQHGCEEPGCPCRVPGFSVWRPDAPKHRQEEPATEAHVYDTRALTDDQRSLADDIASAMGYGHEETCDVWSEDSDGCSCPLLQAVADGLAGADVVEIIQEFGYDPATRRGDRLHRQPFRPHPLSIEHGAQGEHDGPAVAPYTRPEYEPPVAQGEQPAPLDVAWLLNESRDRIAGVFADHDRPDDWHLTIADYDKADEVIAIIAATSTEELTDVSP